MSKKLKWYQEAKLVMMRGKILRGETTHKSGRSSRLGKKGRRKKGEQGNNWFGFVNAGDQLTKTPTALCEPIKGREKVHVEFRSAQKNALSAA